MILFIHYIPHRKSIITTITLIINFITFNRNSTRNSSTRNIHKRKDRLGQSYFIISTTLHTSISITSPRLIHSTISYAKTRLHQLTFPASTLESS